LIRRHLLGLPRISRPTPGGSASLFVQNLWKGPTINEVGKEEKLRFSVDCGGC
jgi:hypothetical protein